MKKRKALRRGRPLDLLVGFVVLVLLASGNAFLSVSQGEATQLADQARQIGDQEKARLLGSGLSTSQLRSLLLERGFSPDEVDQILNLRAEPGIAPAPAPGDLTRKAGALPESLEVVEEEVAPLVGEPAPAESLGVAPFGYRLFSQGPSSFAPPTRLPVGPDYLLGPDDTIVVNGWGPTELSYSLVIHLEGHVVIPEIGVVYLSGLSLREARKELGRLFEKFYPGIQTSITVGQLRTLRVYVVGEVVQPGAYTLSSLSTVFTALYHAGGPTDQGSLRRIRLLRKNRVIGEIDFYQYLLKGDRTNDLPLENEDTIFVPATGPRVTLLGEVRRPATYELVSPESLRDVIRMAGDVRPTGYLKRVQIDRILDNEKHIVLDVRYAQLDSAGESASLSLRDGDTIRVFPVLEGYDNAVWIRGAVKRPSRYELKPEMTLLELIETAEGLEGEAYLPRVEIERTEPNGEIRLLSADLGAILRGGAPDVPLVSKDLVRVYSIREVRPRDEVEIYGEVAEPGRYVLAPNMTLGDLVFRAGGLKTSAYLTRAEISRARPPTDGDRRTSDVIPVRLTDVVSGTAGGSPQYLLQPGDEVFIRRIPQWDSLQTVTIEGEVRFPGTYALRDSRETLADLFERAGGPGEDAFLEAAILERQDEGRVVVNFPKAVFKRSEKENLALVGGDRISVPKIPETVRVEGAVFRPSSLKHVPGKTASFYILKCGGYLDNADRGRVRITRTSGEVVGSRRLWFDPEVERGNVIVVPFKERKREIDWEKIAQVTNVIAGLATTVYLLTEAYKR